MCCVSLENIDLFTKLHGVISQRTVIFTVIILGTYIDAVSCHLKGGQYHSCNSKLSLVTSLEVAIKWLKNTVLESLCVVCHVHGVFVCLSTTISYKNIIYICVFL
jgi:hypothetical protein